MVRATPNHIARLRRAARDSDAKRNETIWSYIAAKILSRAHQTGTAPAWFAEAGKWALDGNADVWCEAMPVVPRLGVAGGTEADSRIDLAWGAMELRPGTAAGIAYSPAGGGGVTFVEAKLHCDISTAVSHDPLRNQMARVIESLVCFQENGGHARYPQNMRFALLTPRRFRDRHTRSRLYNYKFGEYRSNRDALVEDIELSAFPRRNKRRWRYPDDLKERVAQMKMEWWSFEEVLLCDEAFRQFGDELDLLQWASSGMPPMARARVEELLAEEA